MASESAEGTTTNAGAVRLTVSALQASQTGPPPRQEHKRELPSGGMLVLLEGCGAAASCQLELADGLECKKSLSARLFSARVGKAPVAPQKSMATACLVRKQHQLRYLAALAAMAALSGSTAARALGNAQHPTISFLAGNYSQLLHEIVSSTIHSVPSGL
jgi:hypothetical protein